MKYLYILIFALLFNFTPAQKSRINLAEIKTNVQDSTSKYFHERLVYRFQYDPNILDSLEMKNLYYGKNFAKKKKSLLFTEKAAFIDSFKKNNPEETLSLGKSILLKDPTDLEVLALLLRVYSKQNAEDEDFGLRAAQLKRLLQNIIQYREEDGKSDVFTVMSVADEYVLAGFLEIDLREYKRTSKVNKNFISDIWKNGRKKITFAVIDDY